MERSLLFVARFIRFTRKNLFSGTGRRASKGRRAGHSRFTVMRFHYLGTDASARGIKAARTSCKDNETRLRILSRANDRTSFLPLPAVPYITGRFLLLFALPPQHPLTVPDRRIRDFLRSNAPSPPSTCAFTAHRGGRDWSPVFIRYLEGRGASFFSSVLRPNVFFFLLARELKTF